MASTPSRSAGLERFSLSLFALTVLLSVAGLLALLRLVAPSIWAAEFAVPWWRMVCAFGAMSLVVCFLEYFFHRYVLHTPAIPFLRRLYRQHTLHHALTRITRKSTAAGQGILCVENKFPIVEDEQHEAAFFPWYAMAIFALVLSPVWILGHVLLPAFPWFLCGIAALATSLTLYEMLHAINHWSFEKWEPFITHPRWGRFWLPVYGFHLRHHAVIDCNESISGFFGLPVADWVMGTCVIPKTLYADGETWTPEAFRSPKPCALIRRLDAWAEAAVRRYRQGQRDEGRKSKV